uniref:Reverse transcriptase RNase H-like domain-containing protein n=1 Tax=Cyprinus carpio carpio TaxID=630221 RepID=A0A9J7ZHX5_CYPCA
MCPLLARAPGLQLRLAQWLIQPWHLRSLIDHKALPTMLLNWTEEAELHFTRAPCQAPALGIAQSDRPFVRYIHEHLRCMTACLMQDHGGSLRPIHYYSGKLDLVTQGMAPCLRAVQAVHLALQASSGMVLG